VIFSVHAVERYIQFHCIDRAVTMEEARAELEAALPSAVNTKTKTWRGGKYWRLDALGVELVVRDDTVVTVLPPPRFRGLTPMQAEAVALSVKRMRTERDDAQAEMKAVSVKIDEIDEIKRENPHAPDASFLRSSLVEVSRQARARAALLHQERELLLGVLKTMRHQIAMDDQQAKLRAALRIALRFVRGAAEPWGGAHDSADETLAKIADIDPGLVSSDFIDFSKGDSQ
jgi:hypothetical protein